MNIPKIPITDCKHGHLYKVQSRNLVIGVYNEPVQGFVGIREKFGEEYLFTEYHYDTGAPYGTVTPYELVEQCPIKDLAEGHSVPERRVFVGNKPLFDWLKTRETDFHVPCATCGQPYWPVPWHETEYCWKCEPGTRRI